MKIPPFLSSACCVLLLYFAHSIPSVKADESVPTRERESFNFGWLFQKTLWTKKIEIPGIVRPITLTKNAVYEPSRNKEE